MSNFVLALIFATALGGWIYLAAMRRSGGNKTTSLIAALAIALVALIIELTLASFLPKK